MWVAAAPYPITATLSVPISPSLLPLPRYELPKPELQLRAVLRRCLATEAGLGGLGVRVYSQPQPWPEGTRRLWGSEQGCLGQPGRDPHIFSYLSRFSLSERLGTADLRCF